MDLLTIEED
jgi:hypothetical protein